MSYRSHLKGLTLGSFLIVMIFFLSSCSDKTSSVLIHTTKKSGQENISFDPYIKERKKVVKSARAELGNNYKYAGTGPNHWDCSGLALKAYGDIEIQLPRTSRDMSQLAKEIPLDEAMLGDLIFYKKDNRVFHVSIITEQSQDHLWVVHSTSSRGVIEEDILTSTYWKKKIYKVISLAALKQ